jgi:uncharacterized protein (TIGR03083 family)
MEITKAFFRAAEHFTALAEDPATASRWSEPSALAGLTVGGLVAHAIQGVVWLERLLELPRPDDAPVTTLGEYVAGLKVDAPADFEADLHRYVRDLAERGARKNPREMTDRVAEVLARLAGRLHGEPGDRLLDLRPSLPFAMRLDDRIRLEIVELVLHGDDLAVSIDREDTELPHDVVTIAVAALLAAPRLRHGDRAVLRALARRERSTVPVFPVL